MDHFPVEYSYQIINIYVTFNQIQIPEKQKSEEAAQEQTIPWKRGLKREKLAPEQPEEKQWPTGKRRPKPAEEQEEVILKPIPKKKEEPEEKSEKNVEGPVIKPRDIPEVFVF